MSTDIKITKKKLTILFTIIVFLLVFVLEFIYFTTKYYSIKKFDLNTFTNVSRNIELNIDSSDNFINKICVGCIRRNDGPGSINNFLSKNPINFLVLDNSNNTIIFDRVFENINEELLFNTINKIDNNYVVYNKGFYFKKNTIITKNFNYDLIFFKTTSYSFVNYLFDLLFFVLLTLLFSILFYFIGIKFISKILKPVEENLDDMKNFIHNAGHELKTPISIINGNLQLLNEFGKYDKNLTNESIEEIKKLDKLIVGLIELSDISNNQNKEKLNISSEINGIIDNYKTLIKSNKINIIKNIDEKVFLNINKQYFYIFFSNLLNNSIKYNKKGGDINIILSKNSLIITDSGVGIKKEFLNKVFDRFFQVDPSRNTEGFGIGLSLVKKIANIYKWKINIESEEGKYTKIIIILKK